MKNNEEYQSWLELVENDAYAFQYVPEELITREMCELAVTREGDTLSLG